jgi:hypothetical protein
MVNRLPNQPVHLLQEHVVYFRFHSNRTVAKAPIGSPMHAARLFGKRIRQAAAAAEPHQELLQLKHCAGLGILPLAVVGQAVAVPTGKQLAGGVELCNSPSRC